MQERKWFEGVMLVEYGALLALLLLLGGYWLHRLRGATRLHGARDKVRESEALYRQLTEDISDVIWKTDRNLHITYMAFHDPLTGLPNRRLPSDRLRQTLGAGKRSGCHGALMFLDLDILKPLNDTHGHVVGEAAVA